MEDRGDKQGGEQGRIRHGIHAGREHTAQFGQLPERRGQSPSKPHDYNDPYSNADTYAYTYTYTDSNSNSNSNTDADAYTNPNTDAYSNAYTYTYTYAYPNTDSYTDTDTDARKS
jgi:hypothetical protein